MKKAAQSAALLSSTFSFRQMGNSIVGSISFVLLLVLLCSDHTKQGRQHYYTILL